MKAQSSTPLAHDLHVEMCTPLQPVIDVGARMDFSVKVVCSSECDLSGYPVTVFASGSIVSSALLVAQDDGLHKAEFRGIEAPHNVGEHTWDIVFGQGKRTAHWERRLPITIVTRPHKTSLAVWDVPSPVVLGSRFLVRVGVKCSATCDLSGETVEVANHVGEPVGHGLLGKSAWAGTEHLYWAEVELASPPDEEVFSWTARFAATRCRLPHAKGTGTFSFRTVKRPDSKVTIVTVSQDTAQPINDAEIRVGPYHAFSDDSGVAVLHVVRGTYEITIRKDGFTATPKTATLDDESMVTVEVQKTLTKAEMDERLKRFEDYPWG